MAKRQGSLTETRFNLDQLQFAQAEKIQALHNELSTVEQRIAELNGKQAYIVRAPIAGRISLLQVSAGQPADPQRLRWRSCRPAVRCKPRCSSRRVRSASSRSGRRSGSSTTPFPYQQFGTYRRQDHQGLADGHHEGGHDVATPIELKEPAYTATVALDRPDVDAARQEDGAAA